MDSGDGSQCKKVRIAKHFELELEAEAAHSRVERIWAYFRLRQFADSASEQKNTDEAMALAMKFKFVTPWTSMIVVKHNTDDGDDGDAKEPSPSPPPKSQPPCSASIPRPSGLTADQQMVLGAVASQPYARPFAVVRCCGPNRCDVPQ